MSSRLLALLAGSITLCATASAQSITGTWNAAVSSPNGTGTPTILFQVHGDSVTGTVKRPARDVPLRGTLKGDDLTFAYTITYNLQLFVVTVKAKVAGDSLTGNADFGGLASGTFSAKRVGPLPKPSGDDSGQSVSAAIGLTPAARRAGTSVATIATVVRMTATRPITIGSSGRTP